MHYAHCLSDVFKFGQYNDAIWTFGDEIKLNYIFPAKIWTITFKVTYLVFKMCYLFIQNFENPM